MNNERLFIKGSEQHKVLSFFWHVIVPMTMELFVIWTIVWELQPF